MAQAVHTIDIGYHKVSLVNFQRLLHMIGRVMKQGQGERNSAFITDWISYNRVGADFQA